MPRPMYSEEAPPPQLQYREAPQLADQYRQFGSEEFQRNQDQLARNAQSDQNVRQMDVDSANKIGQGITQGVQGGVEAYDKAKQRQRQDREEQRQNMVTEEQLASSKQSREQSAELHPLDIQSKQGAIAGQDSSNKLAATQADEAQKTADIGNSTAKGAPGGPEPEPGETQRQYNARLAVASNSVNLQASQAQIEASKVALENAKHELATNKDLAPLRKKELQASIAQQGQALASANMDLAEKHRQVNVRGAKAEIMSALNSGGDLKAVRDKLGKSVSDQEFAEGIAEANTGRMNSQLLAKSIQNMDPEYQAQIQARVKGINDFRTYKSNLNDLQNAEARYKNSSNLPDSEGKAALDQYVTALHNVGEDKFAEEIQKTFDTGNALRGESPLREARMEKITKTVQSRLASKMHSMGDLDPKFRAYGDSLYGQAYTAPDKSAYIGGLVPQSAPVAGGQGDGGRVVQLTGMPGVSITMPPTKVTSK